MEFIEVKINIGDHSKQIHLVVVELEKASLFLGYNLLWSPDFRVDQEKKSCIGFTQENSV